MKIAIVGSRGFPRPNAVASFVRQLPGDAIVISGGATGVDTIAVDTATGRGLAVEVIRPDYRIEPKLAPKIRNREIAQKCDAMVAFWDGNSGGTANACMWALYYGKDVTVFLPAEEAARREVAQVSK